MELVIKRLNKTQDGKTQDSLILTCKTANINYQVQPIDYCLFT